MDATEFPYRTGDMSRIEALRLLTKHFDISRPVATILLGNARQEYPLMVNEYLTIFCEGVITPTYRINATFNEAP
jgi:hypothetical protein